ncbi:MAG: formate dehydrogenase accessory sulfurtransferase FdhD [Pseudorhodobacter sp.]
MKRTRLFPLPQQAVSRPLAEEIAVAISFNGTTQAVMMASPGDLEDFAYGFALTESIARPEEIETLTITNAGDGIDLQCWLLPEAEARLSARRRTMVGPVGCGLCGIDSISEALRPPPPVTVPGPRLTSRDIDEALKTLPRHQPLHDATRAAHCAAFWNEGRIIAAREDIGRHNALDKLCGHLIRSGINPAKGAILLTSRLSIDLVQKAARLGAPVMIAVSAPTAAAVDLAQSLGITLIGNARAGDFELYTHGNRLTTKVPDAC